jgi:acetyltransferase
LRHDVGVPHPLTPLFAPASVALVGASERAGSVGNAVRQSLKCGGFAGALYWVNPRHTILDGDPCHASLAEVPGKVDLVVVTAPADAVLAIVADAAAAKVTAMVVVSAGFAEAGEEGEALQREVADAARAAGIRLLGPNCVGLLRPSIGLNASFTRTAARPGSVALVSQSGAICTALVDWAADANMGFSSVVSLGAAADIDFGDVLDYLLYDAATYSVLLYVEGVKQGRAFMGSLRALARAKPVVVLKVGRFAAGSKAARSHTGALVGDDAVFDAVLRRCGVVRVEGYHHLFAAATALANPRKPAGPRVALLTNGGGPGALAADAAVSAGLQISALSAPTLATLDAKLPAHWSHGNPVDLMGDANGERFAAALIAVAEDPGVDAIITAYAPTGVSDADNVAQAIVRTSKEISKPLLTAWLGEAGVRQARHFVEQSGLAAYPVAEIAVQALATVTRWVVNQRLLLESPPARVAAPEPDRKRSAAIFARAVAEGRTVLTEVESKELLALWGIPVPPSATATTREEAAQAADRLGYPMALKILSSDITHKSDVDGVRLGLRNAAEVAEAFDAVTGNAQRLRPKARIEGVVVQAMVERRHAREVLVGLTTDPVFGPVVTFGSGGVAVELLRDHAVALPPLNLRLAEDLVSRTRVARLLAAYRNVPAANRDAVLDTLLKVSDMACELPWIAEMDMNPLLVDESGAIALDARIVIDPARPARDAAWSHLSVHPYPADLETTEELRDGSRVLLRPIRPEDGTMETAFITELSDESRYRRFLSLVRHVTPEMVARFTQIDYDREMALIAVPVRNGEPDSIVGVARYVRNADPANAEFAVVTADRWHGRGLATHLMKRLMACARDAGVLELRGMVLANNAPMLALMRDLGFAIASVADDPHTVTATKVLGR